MLAECSTPARVAPSFATTRISERRLRASFHGFDENRQRRKSSALLSERCQGLKKRLPSWWDAKSEPGSGSAIGAALSARAPSQVVAASDAATRTAGR